MLLKGEKEKNWRQWSACEERRFLDWKVMTSIGGEINCGKNNQQT